MRHRSTYRDVRRLLAQNSGLRMDQIKGYGWRRPPRVLNRPASTKGREIHAASGQAREGTESQQ